MALLDLSPQGGACESAPGQLSIDKSNSRKVKVPINIRQQRPFFRLPACETALTLCGENAIVNAPGPSGFASSPMRSRLCNRERRYEGGQTL